MKRLVISICLVLIGPVLLTLSGCGGGAAAPVPAVVSVTLTPLGSTTIGHGQTLEFNAAVSNDSNKQGVSWRVAGSGCSGDACGVMSYTEPLHAHYTASASLDSRLTVAVTATSLKDEGRSASVTVTVLPPPIVATTSLPAGTQGMAYSATLHATGGVMPLHWSLAAGTLPVGLSLNANTGVISGTPSAAQTADFAVRVSDAANPPQTTEQALSIVINAQRLAIITTSLPATTVGAPYNAVLASTGGLAPITWSVVGLPSNGLTMNASGQISGPATDSGAVNLTVTATDSSVPPQTAGKALSIIVNPALSITTSSLPEGTIDEAYAATLQHTGGTAPVTWSIVGGALPAGFNALNPSNGAISGTPTAVGTSDFTVQAADAAGTVVQQALSIKISPAPLILTTALLPGGTVNSSYNQSLHASGGTEPYSWAVTVGTLPAGLNLDAATGAIAGMPTADGVFNFTITVTDSSVPHQTAQKPFSVTISPPLTVLTLSLPDGRVGDAYAESLQYSNGTPPVTWSITAGALPAGLTLNASNGVISGSPTSSGSSNFTVQAKDSTNAIAQQALSIKVEPALLAIPMANLPGGTMNVAYSQALQASGGTPPYSWAVTVGVLPPGLNLAGNTIEGTPTTQGTFDFTVTVTDSGAPAQIMDKALNITVSAAPLLKEGDYAFFFNGWEYHVSHPVPLDTWGYRVAISGHFHADASGNITDGIEDINSFGSVLLSLPFTGSYTVDANHRGTLTINSSQGTTTYSMTVDASADRGRFIKADQLPPGAVVAGAGSFEIQDPTAFTLPGLAGPYAVGVFGSAQETSRVAAVGRFAANTSGLFSAGKMDVADPNTTSNNLTLGGFFGAPSATTGRGTATITLSPPPSGTSGTFHFAYYVISSQKMVMVGTDARSANMPVLSGELRRQNGSFSQASFNVPVILSMTGSYYTSTDWTLDSIVGRLSPNGAGALSAVAYDENRAAILSQNQSASGTYTLDAAGRSTIQFGAKSLIAYFYAGNEGFVLQASEAYVLSGNFRPQTGGPFNAAALSGPFLISTQGPANAYAENDSGLIAFNGINGLVMNQTFSYRDQAGQNTDIPGTYSVSATGRVSLTYNGWPLVFWAISPNEAVGINSMNPVDPLPVLTDYRK